MTRILNLVSKIETITTPDTNETLDGCLNYYLTYYLPDPGTDQINYKVDGGKPPFPVFVPKINTFPNQYLSLKALGRRMQDENPLPSIDFNEYFVLGNQTQQAFLMETFGDAQVIQVEGKILYTVGINGTNIWDATTHNNSEKVEAYENSHRCQCGKAIEKWAEQEEVLMNDKPEEWIKKHIEQHPDLRLKR